jgi:hypothetical protein
MKYQVIQSSEIVWCPEDDRHILIMRENDKIIGINYCQGDDIEYFINNYLKGCVVSDIDHELTNFFLATSPYLNGESELDRINQAIWAHFEYCNLNDSLSAR